MHVIISLLKVVSCSAERAASQGRVILNRRANLSEEHLREEALMKSWSKTGISFVDKSETSTEPRPLKRQKTSSITETVENLVSESSSQESEEEYL